MEGYNLLISKEYYNVSVLSLKLLGILTWSQFLFSILYNIFHFPIFNVIYILKIFLQIPTYPMLEYIQIYLL